MDYGKAVTVIRTAKNLTQKELAELLGKTPSYISRVENNERTPSVEFVNLLCERLKVPVTLFMLLGKNYEQMDEMDRHLLDEMGARLLEIITKS
ncbi:MAG TPA: helix-turn-helix transcriptional regulator [Candidatus Saccharimonadales bacterium]|nr:helix-turn-helix transcriptional regulator [Candidatus Saccharimonadales bacterium]